MRKRWRGLEDEKKKSFGELNSDCDKAAVKVITGNHTDGRAAKRQRDKYASFRLSGLLCYICPFFTPSNLYLTIDYSAKYTNRYKKYKYHWRWEVKK